MTLHHYGFATSDIEKTAFQYEIFGFNRMNMEAVVDPIQNVKLLFLQKDNLPAIELVQPLSQNSPVSNIILKSGPSLYHICYEVELIEQSRNDLRNKGLIPIGDTVRAIAFNNKLICFMYSKHLGLIELLEK
jgi:methylmalonyl-CoA/ethylmalonyl-CoA epimerase